MALEFKLPDIGEGVAEGEVVRWLVKAGDVVKEHQSVVEVMTDKATVEIPAPAAGTLRELRAKPGDVVPVGSVLFVLETSGPAHAAAPAAAAAAAKPAAPMNPAAAKPAAGGAGGAAGAGARIEFKLPDIGEGVAEGEIVRWLAKVGDSVKEHQSIVEVMTDKATVEIPAPATGKLAEIRIQPGQVVPIGTVLFVLEASGPLRAAVHSGVPAHAAAPAHAHASAVAAPAAARAPVVAVATNGSGNGAGASGSEKGGERVLAVPSARRVARELGVDLGSVSGSGRHGIVRRADVEAAARSRGTDSGAAAARGPAPAAPRAPISFAPGERETRVPFRGVRRKIAEAMVRSKTTAMHFTVVEEVDVTELVRTREAAKQMAASSGVKVTFMPFVMKATALALGKYPMLNGHLDEAAQELVRCAYVNLGIAMDTEQGLIVPVLRDVQAKSILELARELAELAERTRSGKVKQEELKGSTFSITNAGNIGGTLATPIINFPDIAILGVHRIMKKPGVVETSQGDRIEVRQYMNLSCSVDHRLADGADAARFLVHMKQLLESPGLLAL